MAQQRIQNPFAQQNSQIGDTIARLGEAIFGGRLSPVELEKKRQESELLRARTDSARNTAANTLGDTRFENRQRGDVDRIVELLGGAEGRLRADVAPSTLETAVGPFLQGQVAREQTAFDKAALPLRLGQAGASAISSPQDLANLFNFAQANTPGRTDVEKIAALLGTGRPLGDTQSVSLAGQDRNREENARLDQETNAAKIAATPFTRSQSEAATLATMTLPERQARLASTGIPTEDVQNGKGQVVTIPRTVLLLPDAERNEIIDRAVPAAPKASQKTGDLEGSTKGQLEKATVAMANYNVVMDVLSETGQNDPTIFGAVGNLRRLGQNLTGQADALLQAFGGDQFEAAGADLAAAGVDPSFFDADLADIEKVATLAAYQSASALAGQTGRALSDKDFALFRRIVGDPTAWLNTQQAFQSGMKRMREVANRLMRNHIIAIQGGVSALGDTGGGAGAQEDLSGTATEDLERRLEALERAQ